MRSAAHRAPSEKSGMAFTAASAPVPFHSNCTPFDKVLGTDAAWPYNAVAGPIALGHKRPSVNVRFAPIADIPPTEPGG